MVGDEILGTAHELDATRANGEGSASTGFGPFSVQISRCSSHLQSRDALSRDDDGWRYARTGTKGTDRLRTQQALDHNARWCTDNDRTAAIA